ncbi:homeobox protein cut-like [Aphis craccivora]|uniref:Homeobox protein cut-like n=1 Tax=Aphis craccivora TaxID=307492 RepID=A0A6G0ZCK1_APHCR|nr:homeobox protein cut-like [Aphis craccivora]
MSSRATLAEKEVTALKEQLTNNKAQDTNVMTMATPLSNHVESTEDQNKTPAELELSAKEKELADQWRHRIGNKVLDGLAAGGV